MSATDLDTRLDDTSTDDPEETAHIVIGKDRLADAIISRTEVQALCGHTFVPERSPENRPVCKPCLAAAERGGWRTEGLT